MEGKEKNTGKYSVIVFNLIPVRVRDQTIEEITSRCMKEKNVVGNSQCGLRIIFHNLIAFCRREGGMYILCCSKLCSTVSYNIPMDGVWEVNYKQAELPASKVL